MKKFVAFVTVVIVCFSFLFCGCGSSQSKETYLKYTSPDAVMTGLYEGTIDFGLLPEPAVSKLMNVKYKNENWKKISIQELYDEEVCAYPQAVLMIKNSVLENYPSLVKSVLSYFDGVSDWIKGNISVAVDSVASVYPNTSLKPAISLTEESIDACKIYGEKASASKDFVNEYISNLLTVSVGINITPAKTVQDDFFYTEEKDGGTYNDKNFTFVVPDGAPALSISKMIYEGNTFGANVIEYKVVSAENIGGYVNGSIGVADFVIMPINSATLLYGGNYKMASVITHGNLYLVYKTDYLDGVVGKTIGVASNEGTVVDLTLKFVLQKYGIDYKRKA